MSELIGVIIDCSAADWFLLSRRPLMPITPANMWEGVVAYLRTIIAGWSDKELALIAVSGKAVHIIFDGRPAAFDALEASPKVVAAVQHAETDALLAPAISQLLLRFNARKDVLSACRILIIDAAPSTAYGRQQPSLFNCGLAAQKTGVIIDVCSLQSPPNAALQQLVQVCGGSYVSWQEVLGQHKAARALQAARPAEALGEFLVVRAGRR